MSGFVAKQAHEPLEQSFFFFLAVLGIYGFWKQVCIYRMPVAVTVAVYTICLGGNAPMKCVSGCVSGTHN